MPLLQLFFLLIVIIYVLDDVDSTNNQKERIGLGKNLADCLETKSPSDGLGNQPLCHPERSFSYVKRKKHEVEGSPECAHFRKGIVCQWFARRRVLANLIEGVFWRFFDSFVFAFAQTHSAQNDISGPHEVLCVSYRCK